MRLWPLLPLMLVSACAKPVDHGWLGYGEGDYAMIAAPQAGWLTSLNAERGSVVKQGQVLFTLDTGTQQANAAAASAQVDAARAALTQEQQTLTYARGEVTRQEALAADQAGQGSALDAARNALRQSQARIAQLQAQIKAGQASVGGADYTLNQRRVMAGVAGPVQDILFRPGEFVGAGTPVVSILPPGQVFARFFVPEPQMARMKIGGRVRITCDGCQPMEGTITFIAAQAEYTPPVVFSVGSREKLVWKVEARSRDGLPLHPGQPIEVRPL